MNGLLDYIEGTIQHMKDEHADLITETFSTLYADYETNPTQENLNKAVTGLQEVYNIASVGGDGRSPPLPTLKELADKIYECAQTELRMVHGEDFTLPRQHIDIDYDDCPTDEVSSINHHIPEIQRLKTSLYRNVCCIYHKTIHAVNASLLNIVIGNHSESNNQLTESICGLIHNNLQLLRNSVEIHLRRMGDAYLD
ncbi:hypothetical protein GCK72_024935 [Caenorhabditis remanei]|nr:hypothetical protein GCK72_024935 [Caenorhabditis remanei]KAF1748468.1 hypothetical protein GCK72_024935 [Caenorhabditis remanei]